MLIRYRGRDGLSFKHVGALEQVHNVVALREQKTRLQWNDFYTKEKVQPI
jgi:hypothetical protein